MMDVIGYLRSLFGPNHRKRKRSSCDLLEDHLNSKQRKISTHILDGDFELPSSKFYGTRSIKMGTSKPNIALPTIVINDDLEFKNYNGTKSKSPIASTPKVRSPSNGYDFQLKNMKLKDFTIDLTDGKKDDFESKLNLSRQSSNTSVYFTPKVSMTELSTQRRSLVPSKYSSLRPTSNFNFRLDEKEKYKELLNRAQANTPSCFQSSLSKYYTPLIRTPPTRNKRILDLARTPALIDLTNGGESQNSGRSSKTATSETVRKVLDDFDNDVVVINDSDSDCLPRPPSPKPDIKVERVNSLKKLVACDPLKNGWISETVRKHQLDLAQIKEELAAREEKLARVRQVNHEIVREQLSDQLKKCLHIKDAVIPVEVKQALPELTDKQEEMVDFALDKRASPNAVLASKFSINISRRDMLTLAGLNWLNDEVINFYMNLIIERGKLDKYPRTYAFNTFFYPKILKDGQQSVRRWTRKVDIFAHDLICVPIHLGVHWCMATIDFRAKSIAYYDSMGKPNRQCTEALYKYLQDEHADKKQSAFDTTGWKQSCPRDIPQQMNGSDCGMFSCTYAEFASRSAAFSFSQDDMPYLRRKMVVEIMTGQLLIQ